MNEELTPIKIDTVDAAPRKTETQILVYMPQLDGVRFVAVALVFMAHAAQMQWSDYWATLLPLGEIGVAMFFVLSGFLITGILLDNRKPGDSVADRIFTLKRFYIRRFLRIFPAYYLLVFSIALLAWPHIRDGFVWHVFYLSNFYVIRTNEWIGHFSHFWSLAIEEQFYLVWPLLMLFVRTPRAIKGIIVACVALGVVSRFAMFSANFVYDTQIHPFTLSNTDALAIGGLLAYELRHGAAAGGGVTVRLMRSRGFFLATLALFCFAALLKASFGAAFVYDVFGKTLLACFLAHIILRSAEGYRGFAGRFLSNKVVVYLGSISYGLYLYHFFMLWVGWKLMMRFTPSWHLYTGAVLAAALTVFASACSFHLFESPINKLKKHFGYRKSSAAGEIKKIEVFPGSMEEGATFSPQSGSAVLIPVEPSRARQS